MDDILSAIGRVQGIPLWVLYAVLAATGAFLLAYLPRGIALAWQLGRSARRVRALRRPGVPVPPADVARLLGGRPYRDLWREYERTLHRVDPQAPPGEDAPAHGAPQLRATVPAAALFTREALVDGRLFDEFVRHLPGILTGLGIIGTFAGLLTGLQGFDPSEDPAAARLGLHALLGGVEHAFYTSAVAIGCAIMVTLIEKLVMARCYLGAEALAQAIDSLYAGGAGEDYLARLVRATEANALAIAGLREALLASARPAPAAAADAAATAPERLDAAVAGLAARMTDTVERVIDRAAAHQAAVDDQARAALAEMRRQADAQRAASEQAMRATLGAALAQVSDSLAAMSADRQASAQAEQLRHERLDASVDRAWRGLSSEVSRLLTAVSEASARSESQIAAIERVSMRAVDGIGDGVQAMNATAERFAAVADAVADTAARASDTGAHLLVAAQTLQQACATVDRAFERYEAARAGIDAQTASLAALIDNAKREAGLNRELLVDMQASVQTLRGVQQESSRHLEEVNDKLLAAFDAFGRSMKAQVAVVMRQTDQHTSTAMQHLLGMVQELGVALSRAKRA